MRRVLDRNTGLVWERSPEKDVHRGWFSALQLCVSAKTGGQLGWRLPAIQELASLVDPTVPFPGPTLPAGHPFQNMTSSFYWSSTTFALSAGFAWGVLLNVGAVSNDNKNTGSDNTWCVRGGSGLDAQ